MVFPSMADTVETEYDSCEMSILPIECIAESDR